MKPWSRSFGESTSAMLVSSILVISSPIFEVMPAKAASPTGTWATMQPLEPTGLMRFNLHLVSALMMKELASQVLSESHCVGRKRERTAPRSWRSASRRSRSGTARLADGGDSPEEIVEEPPAADGEDLQFMVPPPSAPVIARLAVPSPKPPPKRLPSGLDSCTLSTSCSAPSKDFVPSSWRPLIDRSSRSRRSLHSLICPGRTQRGLGPVRSRSQDRG